MTEGEAKRWFAEHWPSDRVAKVDQFLTMVAAENDRQNLVAPSTITSLWSRHAVDSAQLIALADDQGDWLDVGTGGGFPGMIVAILRDAPMIMVEPRRRRVEFLEQAVTDLNLGNAIVKGTKVEQVTAKASVISARAVASVEKLLQATAHCATPSTRWILPRGRLDGEQLTELRQQQRGKMFHVEHSLTDPESSILIVETRR